MIVETEVLAVLSGAVVVGNALRLVGQLDRKLYERTNKVIEAAGGKWNRKAKSHLFDGEAAEAIDQIILTGEIQFKKQDFGQFDSPPLVVARVIELAEIEPGMAVLEPSAGHGNIARALLFKDCAIDCVEIDEKRAGGLATKFGPTDPDFRKIVPGDFLGIEPIPIYDRVVMNPPFARQADIKHVMHALRFLKLGGRLVSVMSAGTIFRQDAAAKGFRDLLAKHGGEHEALPTGAFKESGTLVNAVIVSMRAAA